jgi:hypothetical protein
MQRFVSSLMKSLYRKHISLELTKEKRGYEENKADMKELIADLRRD